MKRQCESGPWARRSRPWAAALAAFTLAGLAPRGAAAAPREAPSKSEASAGPSTEASAEATTEVDPPPQPPTYSGALTVAYTLAPLLAIPVGAGLFELTGNDAVAVVGAGLAVVSVPVTTHLLNGEASRGVTSGLLLPLVTLGGTVVGGFLGAILGSAGCDDSDCELAGGIGGAIVGGLVGGTVSYVGYAIYDVSEHSSLERPHAARGQLSLWALPVIERREGAPEQAAAELGGGLIGAKLDF
jgi:hypothetical protein